MGKKAHNSNNPETTDAKPLWQRSVLPLGLIGGMLFYLAQPPVAWGLLAWISPVPWLLLVKREKLPGKRPYRGLWFCGFLMWLVTVQWLRLAHPSNHLALLLLATYLGTYLPVFVGLTRVAHDRLGMPLWRAAPIVWTGLELIRAHLATGFMMGSLAHTQVKFPVVLQIADLAGEYGVTFLIVLVGGAIADALPARGLAVNSSHAAEPQAVGVRWKALQPIALVMVLVAIYDLLSIPVDSENGEPQTVALIQGDAQATWKFDPDRKQRIMQELLNLSWEAKSRAEKEGRSVDLVIWPETAYRESLFSFEEGFDPPDDFLAMPVEKFVSLTRNDLKGLATAWEAGLLFGIDRRHVSPSAETTRGEDASDETVSSEIDPFEVESWNSVVFVDRAGEVQGTYDKMHLVPYGEYTPFSSWFPYPDGFTPLTGGVTAGEGPQSFEFESVRYSPTVCYEKAVPHLMRWQFSELAEQGKAPDILVNVTNDAWYWGSAELDMHLACGILRAVELRTPMLIAGNRGLSAHIDAAGNVIAVTERNQSTFLLAQVKPRNPENGSYQTVYSRWGDWLPTACLVCCVVFATVGWAERKGTSPREPA
ncbi:MAG: apolipoprotein N-acyltransferase [Lacipirellulaceae bacterium]